MTSLNGLVPAMTAPEKATALPFLSERLEALSVMVLSAGRGGEDGALRFGQRTASIVSVELLVLVLAEDEPPLVLPAEPPLVGSDELIAPEEPLRVAICRSSAVLLPLASRTSTRA